MGLDQWIYYYDGNQPHSKVNFSINGESKELFYWRKHYKLNEYMLKLYQYYGGIEEFNCKKNWLGIENINNLKEEILNNKLFDDELNLEDNENQKKEDLKFCDLAIKKIEENFQIYYTNWW
jgi:hypothetical protein